MPEWTLDLKATGEENLTQALRKVTRELNEQHRAVAAEEKQLGQISRFRKAISDLARKERQEAFERLSTEEKLVRLQQQREKIQQRLTRAEGNQYRTSALQLRLAQTESQLRQITPGSGPGLFRGSLNSIGAAMFGGFLAGGIGGIVAQITSLISTKIGDALHQSSEIKDVAEQFDLNPRDILRMRRASLQTGTESAVGLRGMGTLAIIRSAALGGDQRAIQLLQHYGVTEQQLKDFNQTPMDLGLTVRRSLGNQGAQPGQAEDMRMLFGRRWQEVQALFTGLAGLPQDATTEVEKQIHTLDEANKTIERQKAKAGSLWRRLTAGVVGEIGGIKEGLTHPPTEEAKKLNQRLARLGLGPWYDEGGSKAPETHPGIPAAPSAIGPANLDIPSKSQNSMSGFRNPSPDALARIGLFIGPRGPTALEAHFQRHFDLLTSIRTEITTMRRDIEHENSIYF